MVTGRLRGSMGPLAVALLAFSCSEHRSSGKASATSREGIEWFTDRARESGLDFVHFNGMTGAFHFPEVIPPGVAPSITTTMTISMFSCHRGRCSGSAR